jgi:hypothetical protein
MNFLKLSTVIINPKFIQKILIKPEWLEIYISHGTSGTLLAGSGRFDHEYDLVKVPKDSESYKNVEQYFSLNTKDSK